MIMLEGGRNVFHLWAHKIDYISLNESNPEKFKFYKLSRDMKFQNNDFMDNSQIIAKQILIVEPDKKSSRGI